MNRIECEFRLQKTAKGRRRLAREKEPISPPTVPSGRVPRISKLMALAIRFESLVRDGVVADYAELARLGHVSRARITQVMNLLLLAPDIQETLLFLPRIERGKDRLRLAHLQRLAMTPDWVVQRELFKSV